MPDLNSKQAKIYREIWATPYSKKLKFSDVSNLLVTLGCERSSKGGANVSFVSEVILGECIHRTQIHI
jgi:hypothetical protein